jgi:hypothetical protein
MSVTSASITTDKGYEFLHHFIWSRVSNLMQFGDGCDKGTASNFIQISEKV